MKLGPGHVTVAKTALNKKGSETEYLKMKKI